MHNTIPPSAHAGTPCRSDVGPSRKYRGIACAGTRTATVRTPAGRRRVLAVAAIAATALAGCASMAEPEGPALKENAYAVTQSMRLISFNAGQPARVLGNRPLTGLEAGERIVGIDYRVARGMLYALGERGRIYVIDTAAAAAKPIGDGLQGLELAGGDPAFDFNPTVDRIRLVTGGVVSARAHPDTGRVVDSNADTPGMQLDGRLAYVPGDVNAGKTPRVQAAAYTYNKVDEKITTNFAIDAAAGVLVTQGTREGMKQGVSPNSGQLFTVGPLKAGAIGQVSFDIADPSNAAFVAITAPGAKRSRWFRVDLASGLATPLGTIGVSEPVNGMAIEP